MPSLSVPATTSIYMMLFKYKQYDKIIHLYEIMSKLNMSLDENVQLSIIRSYSNCQRLEDALSVMNNLIHSIESQIQSATDESTKAALRSQLLKAYSTGIEVNCRNNQGDAALSLLHEMAEKTEHSLPIPRSCYTVLFNYFSSNDAESESLKNVKAKLNEM